MKVSYDAEADATHIKLSDDSPYGAIEIDEGLIVHVANGNKIIAIEILDASQKINLHELLKFEIEDIQLGSHHISS